MPTIVFISFAQSVSTAAAKQPVPIRLSAKDVDLSMVMSRLDIIHMRIVNVSVAENILPARDLSLLYSIMELMRSRE